MSNKTTVLEQANPEGLLSLLTQTLIKEARNVSVVEEISKMEQRIIRQMEEHQERLVQRLWKEAPPIPPAMMSVKQAAVYIGRSEHALEVMVSKGKVETVRLDGRVQLRRAYLDHLIESGIQRGYAEL